MHKILKLREECFLSWSSQRKEYLLHISRLEKFSQSCQTILQFSLNATANLLSSESCSMMHSSPLKHFRGNVASTYTWCICKLLACKKTRKEGFLGLKVLAALIAPCLSSTESDFHDLQISIPMFSSKPINSFLCQLWKLVMNEINL